MHAPLKTGLNLFLSAFLRYALFCARIAPTLGGGKFFFSENFSDVPCKSGIRIFLRRARNEQHRAGYAKTFRIGAECFSQKAFDTVAHDALPVFFADAHCKARFIGGHPDDRQGLRVRTFSHPQDFRKVLLSLDPQVFHGDDLRGNVLSALVSSSL